ncbi:unnamed protein product [Lymnaea stagnalis]|uniref:Ig-like domain-containing protein n=1 Tax=Lymnaea stagnalis TaxID=6523 RepID=A0AAV2ICJ4_LYMST
MTKKAKMTLSEKVMDSAVWESCEYQRTHIGHTNDLDLQENLDLEGHDPNIICHDPDPFGFQGRDSDHLLRQRLSQPAGSLPGMAGGDDQQQAHRHHRSCHRRHCTADVHPYSRQQQPNDSHTNGRALPSALSGVCRILHKNSLCAILTLFGLLISGVHCQHMRFIDQPANRSAAVDSTVVLNCSVANREGLVQWTKGGFGLGVDRHLPGFDRYSMVGNENEGVFNLQIQDVTIDDQDWYECQVQTSPTYTNGLRSRRGYLSVVVSPERPSIINAPTIPVVLHTPTNITCRADRGKPAAQITWHLDDQRLTHGVSVQTQQNGKYIDTIGVLTFNATMNDASKRIECQAFTEFMQSPLKAYATLDVQFAPDLTLSLNVTNRNIREHDYVKFHCAGKANPFNVQWKWFRNGVRIPEANTYTYHIQAITPEYNGDTLACEATNTVGSTRVEKNLIVEYGPRINHITEVVGADLGKSADLECLADGNPEPSVIWRRKDRATLAHRTLSTKSKYHIDQVNSQSFGWYVCTASVVGFPESSREAMLLRNDEPNMRSEKQQMATEGERGKIECLTNSIPKPISITWLKSGKEINFAMSGRFSKEDKNLAYGVKSTLHIQVVQSGDFGVYNCTVSNSYGTVSEQIELIEKHVLPITYIIIGIIGGLAFIFVTALVCILYRRCKREDQGSVLGETSGHNMTRFGFINKKVAKSTPAATGSYTDTDSSSEKKREKADSPNTLMGQFRQEYRFSADYDDVPYKEQQSKGNNNGYGFIEPCETFSDNQIFDGEYVRRGDDLVPDRLDSLPRLDPMYTSGTAYSMSSFRGNYYETTPPPTMTRLTPLHMSNSKLATDV